MTTRLAVLGHPVGHSRSPALHDAAYRVLGLDWEYGAVDLPAEGLAGFVTGLDASWRGLSLTMPHKQVVLPLLDSVDPVATLTGAANTVLFDEAGRHGFNTDVQGIVAALREANPEAPLRRGLVLGNGATAASALVALAESGARGVTVLARNQAKSEALAPLAERLGVELEFGELATERIDRDYDAVIATLPGGVADGLVFSAELRERATLLDVAYSEGLSKLSQHWAAAGGAVVPGLAMLLHQAIEQVRIFVTGGRDAELPYEDEVVAAMRASIGL